MGIGETMIDNSKQLRAREERGEDEEVRPGPRSSVWARMKDKLAKTAAIVAISGLAVAGTKCTYDVPPLGNDASMDGGQSDGGQDAGPQPDGGEAGMDAGHDGGDGGGPIDGGDGGDGGGPIDGGDGGSDAGVITCASTTTGSFSGFITTTTPQSAAGYTFSYGGIDGMGKALITISCAEGTFESALPCPVSIETDVSRPSDGTAPAGRTIKITPSSANATTTGVSINVTHP